MPLTDLESLQAAMLQTDFNNYADFLTYYIAKETNSGESFADFEDEMRSNPIFKSYADFFLFKIAQVDFSAGGGGGGGGTTITGRAFINDPNGLPTKDRVTSSAGDFFVLQNAANSGYTGSGTGAANRLVSDKLKEFVSIYDFGGRTSPYSTPDYFALNDAAILAADTYCTATGKTLLLGDYDDILLFSTPFVLSGLYSVISRGELRHYNSSDRTGQTFITVGQDASTGYFEDMCKQFEFEKISCYDEVASTGMIGYTGIKFKNLSRCNIVFAGRGIEYFNISCVFEGQAELADGEAGFVFNNVRLPICYGASTSIQLKTTGTKVSGVGYGFCNSNIFTGGGAYTQTNGYGIALQADSGGINCNLFTGFSFEMNGSNNIPVFASGSVSDNVMRDFRNENNLNAAKTFFYSTSVLSRRNLFIALYDDPSNYLAARKIVAVAGTFNTYKNYMHNVLETFKGKLYLPAFEALQVTNTLQSINQLECYKIVAGVLTNVSGFTSAEATITASGFSLASSSNFFGKRLKLTCCNYVLIRSLIAETTVAKNIFIAPYLNGSPVTNTTPGGVFVDGFISFLYNAADNTINCVNNHVLKLSLNNESGYDSDFTMWVNTTLVDEVIVLVSQASIIIGGGDTACTWNMVEIATGNNEPNYTEENKPKIQAATLSSGGTTTLPAATPAKGIIITGTAADTISIGTTAAGTDIVDNAVLDSNGKFISNDLFYFTTDQTIHISGNTNPVTVILPI